MVETEVDEKDKIKRRKKKINKLFKKRGIK